MTYFGVRLHALRKQDNLTQLQLAKALGVSKSTVGMWETGGREPDFETLESIADYFNVPIGTFFANDNWNLQDPASSNKMTVSDFERDIITRLRRLPEEQQRAFLLILTGSNTQEP